MLDAKFPVVVVEGVPVVAVPEEVDVTNANGLRLALLHAAAGSPPAVVVDMTRTQFCDSAGLNVLVSAHKNAQAVAGEVLLAQPGPIILRVMELTGIDQAITSLASLDKALAAAHESAERRGRRQDTDHD
jgi:anti-anti-sigma factor